jgi:hypothetical protein
MTFDPAYLGRSLDNRLPDVHEAVSRDVRAVQSNHAASGRLQSGATLIAFEEISTKLLKSSIADAAKFTFELTGGHEPDALAYLKNFSGRVQQIIMARSARRPTGWGSGKSRLTIWRRCGESWIGSESRLWTISHTGCRGVSA